MLGGRSDSLSLRGRAAPFASNQSAPPANPAPQTEWWYATFKGKKVDQCLRVSEPMAQYVQDAESRLKEKCELVLEDDALIFGYVYKCGKSNLYGFRKKEFCEVNKRSFNTGSQIEAAQVAPKQLPNRDAYFNFMTACAKQVYTTTGAIAVFGIEKLATFCECVAVDGGSQPAKMTSRDGDADGVMKRAKEKCQTVLAGS